MREILFRGKRLFDKKWIYGSFVKNWRGRPQIISDENDTMYDVAPETVGRYTGLTDKNGKKIFEGDIVRDTETSDVGEIYFHTDTARFVIEFETMIVDFDNYDNCGIEIIGNIYDNPELIGGADNG